MFDFSFNVLDIFLIKQEIMKYIFYNGILFLSAIHQNNHFLININQNLLLIHSYLNQKPFYFKQSMLAQCFMNQFSRFYTITILFKTTFGFLLSKVRGSHS